LIKRSRGFGRFGENIALSTALILIACMTSLATAKAMPENENDGAMPPIGGHTFAPITMEGETSGNSTWNVKINWFTNELGKQNVFAITLTDAKSMANVEDAEFDFSVVQEGKVLTQSHITEPTSPGQAYGAQYNFTNAGSYVIRIDNINNTGESIKFPVQVTPEFPVFLLAAVTAAVMGTVVASSHEQDQAELMPAPAKKTVYLSDGK